ncbi:unnamed protein product [Linum trigynum]|uniref:Uncharacterized protein n=1 Tax=Linum trigynum TaxID=586398 RepID=A0AAV2CKB9_9ROSI
MRNAELYLLLRRARTAGERRADDDGWATTRQLALGAKTATAGDDAARLRLQRRGLRRRTTLRTDATPTPAAWVAAADDSGGVGCGGGRLRRGWVALLVVGGGGGGSCLCRGRGRG